jgi:hypothetical protein
MNSSRAFTPGLDTTRNSWLLWQRETKTIPEGREFKRIWKSLSFRDRRRLRRIILKGERAKDPNEALIVAALARRYSRWSIVRFIGMALSAALGASGLPFTPLDELALWNDFGHELLIALVVGAFGEALYIRPNLRKAEELNTKLAFERYDR